MGTTSPNSFVNSLSVIVFDKSLSSCSKSRFLLLRLMFVYIYRNLSIHHYSLSDIEFVNVNNHNVPKPISVYITLITKYHLHHACATLDCNWIVSKGCNGLFQTFNNERGVIHNNTSQDALKKNGPHSLFTIKAKTCNLVFAELHFCR